MVNSSSEMKKEKKRLKNTMNCSQRESLGTDIYDKHDLLGNGLFPLGGGNCVSDEK